MTRDLKRKYIDLKSDRDLDLEAPTRAGRAPLISTSPVDAQLDREADGNGVHEGAEAAVAGAEGSSGSALPGDVREKFEGSLGADLSSVRVHTGSESESAAASVGARAYTVGNDIHFGRGQYDPAGERGQHLLAHEVAHTVQQGPISRKPQFKLEVSTPGDAHEVEADSAASDMVAGRETSITAASGLSRKISRDKDGGGAGPADGAQTLAIKLGGETKLGKAAKLGPFEAQAKLKYEVAGKLTTSDGKKDDKKPDDGGAAPAKDDGGGAAPAHAPAPAQTKTEVGAKVAKGEAGWTADVKHQFEEQVLAGIDWTPELKGGGEITNKGGKLSVSASVSTKVLGSVKLTFKPIEFALIKWKPGEVPDIGVLSASADASFPAWEPKLDGGAKFSAEPKITLSVDLTPNKTQIALWLFENLGAECLLSLGALVVPAAAAAAIAGGLYMNATEGAEIGQLAVAAGAQVKDYASCYASALSGANGGGGTAAGAQGAGKAMADLAGLKDKFPEAVIAEKVKSMGMRSKILSAAKPQFKQAAIDSFKKNHPYRCAIIGVPPDLIYALDIVLNGLD